MFGDAPIAAHGQGLAGTGRRPGPVALRLRPGHRGAPQIGFALPDPRPAGRPWPAGDVLGAERRQPAADPIQGAWTGWPHRTRQTSRRRYRATVSNFI